MTIRPFAAGMTFLLCLNIYSSSASDNLVFSLNIEPGITNFRAPVIDNEELNVGNNFSFSYNLGIGYTFNNYIGLATGLTYYTLRSEMSSDRYFDQLDSYDTEDDYFIMTIQGDDYKESVEMDYLQIPVTFLLNIPLGYTFNILFEPSITYSIRKKGEFNTTGNFSYQGYYPEYNLTLSDLPEYGFEDDVETNYTGKISSKNFVGASVRLGFRLKFSHTFAIQFGGIYGVNLSPVLEESQSSDHPLVSPTQINSAIGTTDNYRFHRLGGFIGLRFSFF